MTPGPPTSECCFGSTDPVGVQGPKRVAVWLVGRSCCSMHSQGCWTMLQLACYMVQGAHTVHVCMLAQIPVLE
jgi:hypothetical protein